MNATIVILAVILYIVFLGMMIFMYIALWKIYTKASKPGWASLVPIYNIIVMLEIAKKPTWWIFMMLIPIANFVFAIMIINGISKNFGKSEGFTVGMIFLPYVFYPILGFGSAQYIGAEPLEAEDLLDSH